MTTGEGAGTGGGARDEKDKPRESGERDRDERGQRINVGGGDDAVTRIQLAARWAETYGPRTDSLEQVLKRFRAAYEYLDAVTHGLEPADFDRELLDVRPTPAQPTREPMPAPAYAPPPAPQLEPASTPQPGIS